MYSPPDCSAGQSPGLAPEFLTFYDANKNRRRQSHWTKSKKIKGSAGFVLGTASILFQAAVAAHSSVHTPIGEKITVFKLCSSWVSLFPPSDIQVSVFK